MKPQDVLRVCKTLRLAEELTPERAARLCNFDVLFLDEASRLAEAAYAHSGLAGDGDLMTTLRKAVALAVDHLPGGPR